MKMRKLAALIMALAVLCTAFSGLTLTASASDITLSTDYDAAMTGYEIGTLTTTNAFRWGGYLVKYTPDFDFATNCAGQYSAYAAYKTRYDTYGAGYTCTNQYGYEIAVNAYGYVVEASAAGNLKIPTDGYVLSAVNTDDQSSLIGTNFKNNVKVGDYIRESNGVYYAYRTTDDSKFTDESAAFAVPYTNVNGGSYAKGVTIGGDGVTTGSTVWQTDVLVKATGTGAGGTGYYVGYVVKVGGNDIEVPDGYFAITLSGQTVSDDGTYPYNVSQFFEDFATTGTVVNCGSNEIYIRHDVAAAIRAAQLLTGVTDSSLAMPVETVYEFSANTIVNDALTKYELVDTASMVELYNNMTAIASKVTSMTSFEELEPYMATLYQNYAKICELEYEVRTVEMRATWIRPLSPYDTQLHTAEELDAMLTEKIVSIKNQGYNMIFVEAMYNSTTIFPVDESIGYNGLHFQQNPYLTKAYNTNLDEDYDMLQRFIDICKENDVEPHIWWEVFYVGYVRTNGSTDSLFEYSVAQQILNDQETYAGYLNEGSNGDMYYGAYTDGALQYFLNPASEGARQFLLNTFTYVWETYDASSFQLDYIRYPHTSSAKSFGYDDATLEAFTQSEYYNASVHTTDYLYSYSGFFDEAWVQFRADYVTSFIEEIRSTMSEVAPAMYLTASPGADAAESKANLMQDVEYWLENDYIDIIFPMAYGVNVPGDIAADVVSGNSDHFVCIGVSGSYLDDAVEARWLKEIRDAGADGLAAFGVIPDYVNYVWNQEAVTPTGDSLRATRQYLTYTVSARAQKMYTLGGITQTQLEAITDAITTVDQVASLYGVEAEQTLAAINALKTVAATLDANPGAALEKDADYLLKIRNNSRDEARQLKLATESTDTLSIGGATLAKDTDNFVYTPTTAMLGVLGNGTLLQGSLASEVTLVFAQGVTAVELKDVTLNVKTVNVEDTVMVELTGTNVVTAETWNNNAFTYMGTGEIYNGSTLVKRMGDVVVDEDDTLNTTDVRELLKYNVRMVEFSTVQESVADANGDGKINTIDTRMFLDAILR